MMYLRVGRYDLPEGDWEKVSKECVRAYMGRTVVQMAHPLEAIGSVYLPSSANMETDVGVVVSAGPDVSLLPGDVVLVHPEHGKHMRGFRSGWYRPDTEVRFYGCAAASGGKAVRVPWHRSILGMIDGKTVRATEHNVVIDRGPVNKTSGGGIWLPDSETYRPSEGVVVSVGPKCDPDIKVGSKVVYMANLMLPIKGFAGYGELDDSERNLGIVHESGILCEVV